MASWVGRAGAGAAEAAAAVEQLAERQPTQLVAESVGGGHDHAAQLHERELAGYVDRGPPRQQQQPQRLLMLARARSCPTLVREGRASGTDCVELVVFAAQPPLAAAGAVDLMHLLALALKVPDKPAS